MSTPSKAQSGRGTEYAIGPSAADGAGAYTPVEEVNDLDFTAPEWGIDDTSNFDSDKYAEKLATMMDGGTVTLTFNRVSGSAGQIQLKAANASGEAFQHRITFPKVKGQTVQGDTYTFNGFVLSIGQTRISPKSKIQSVVKIQITGGVTETTGN